MEINDISKILETVIKLCDRKISEQISTLINDNTKGNDPYQSENIKELATAFAKAQGEFKSIEYNRENPYFKTQYVDLYAILKGVRPALTKNGISFLQYTELSRDGKGPTILHTRLLHSSGQWVETRSRIIPPKNDQQSYGSTLTYQKRYAAASLLGIAASDDSSDDDGEVAMIETRQAFVKGPSTKYNPREQSYQTITKEQLEELEYELAQYPDIGEEVIDKLKLQSLADLPRSKFQISITRIREIKELRNEGSNK